MINIYSKLGIVFQILLFIIFAWKKVIRGLGWQGGPTFYHLIEDVTVFPQLFFDLIPIEFIFLIFIYVFFRNKIKISKIILIINIVIVIFMLFMFKGGPVYGLIHNTKLECDLLRATIGDPDECFSNLAFRKKDINLCKKIYEKHENEGCYFKFAKENDDNSICKNDSCFEYFVRKNFDISLCEKISEVYMKASCYETIANETKDLSICEPFDGKSKCGIPAKVSDMSVIVETKQLSKELKSGSRNVKLASYKITNVDGQSWISRLSLESNFPEIIKNPRLVVSDKIFYPSKTTNYIKDYTLKEKGVSYLFYLYKVTDAEDMKTFGKGKTVLLDIIVDIADNDMVSHRDTLNVYLTKGNWLGDIGGTRFVIEKLEQPLSFKLVK